MNDERLEKDAYLQYDGQLWRMLGKERNYDGTLTGCYELENARDLTVVAVAIGVLRRHAVLVRKGPRAALAHLNAQMDRHLSEVGLNARVDASVAGS